MTTRPPSHTTARTTAVVWSRRGHPPPGELIDALSKGGVDAVVVAGPFAALAELGRVESARAARLASALSPGPAPALVIVSPERIVEAAEVLEAIDRYAPSTRCWMYGPEEQPRLAALTEVDRIRLGCFAAGLAGVNGVNGSSGPTPVVRTTGVTAPKCEPIVAPAPAVASVAPPPSPPPAPPPPPASQPQPYLQGPLEPQPVVVVHRPAPSRVQTAVAQIRLHPPTGSAGENSGGASGPMGMVIGPASGGARPHSADDRTSGGARPLLTNEELRMLLEDDAQR